MDIPEFKDTKYFDLVCFISDSKLSRLMSDYEVTLVNDNSKSHLQPFSYFCSRCPNHATVYAIRFATLWYSQWKVLKLIVIKARILRPF